jgi:Flp pilus assembly protein TadD
MNAMNVMSLNAYRSFGELLEIGISHADGGDHREALARLMEAMEKMSTESDGLNAADGAALFLNLALVTGRMGRSELAMELLERSRELFARVLGRERVVGPDQG